MTSKTIVIALVIAFVAFKGGKLGLQWIEPPGCHSDAAINGLITALHDPALGTIAINNARSLSGGILSDHRTCTAEIAPLRGGVDAEDMHWMGVVYQVKKSAIPDQADVTAELGGRVPLAPERSDFAQWVDSILD